MTDWLELAIDERNRRYFREQSLSQVFIRDCWRGKEDFGIDAERNFAAVPCASDIAKRLEAA